MKRPVVDLTHRKQVECLVALERPTRIDSIDQPARILRRCRDTGVQRVKHAYRKTLGLRQRVDSPIALLLYTQATGIENGREANTVEVGQSRFRRFSLPIFGYCREARDGIGDHGKASRSDDRLLCRARPARHTRRAPSRLIVLGRSR